MKMNGKLKTVVLDFDDLADDNSRFDVLLRLKERDPGFKVTLFAIPTRCSDNLLKAYNLEKEWIALGIHGWRHSRHECLSWTSEETEEKLRLAKAIYADFAPIFKAPNWQFCDEVYVGCKNSGVAVADHVRNIEILPDGMPHYIYNLLLREDPYVRLHGHIQPYADTGLEEAYETWASPPIGSQYLFAHEVARAGKELDI